MWVIEHIVISRWCNLQIMCPVTCILTYTSLQMIHINPTNNKSITHFPGWSMIYIYMTMGSGATKIHLKHITFATKTEDSTCLFRFLHVLLVSQQNNNLSQNHWVSWSDLVQSSLFWMTSFFAGCKCITAWKRNWLGLFSYKWALLWFGECKYPVLRNYRSYQQVSFPTSKDFFGLVNVSMSLKNIVEWMYIHFS